MMGAVRRSGATACMTIGGATATEVFHVSVRALLCPTRRPGDLVLMDSLFKASRVIFRPPTPENTSQIRACLPLPSLPGFESFPSPRKRRRAPLRSTIPHPRQLLGSLVFANALG
jgi:hypothetical protein